MNSLKVYIIRLQWFLSNFENKIRGHDLPNTWLPNTFWQASYKATNQQTGLNCIFNTITCDCCYYCFNLGCRAHVEGRKQNEDIIERIVNCQSSNLGFHLISALTSSVGQGWHVEDSSFLICQMKYMVQVISKFSFKILRLPNSIHFILLLPCNVPFFIMPRLCYNML